MSESSVVQRGRFADMNQIQFAMDREKASKRTRCSHNIWRDPPDDI